MEDIIVQPDGYPIIRHHDSHMRRFRISRAGGFGSLTAFVLLVLLGFVLYTFYHWTFEGLLGGFVHFIW